MRPEDCNSELSATTRPTMAEDCVNDNIKTSNKLFLSCTVYDARGQKNPHSFVLPSLILEQLLVHTVQSFRFSLIFSSPSPSSSSKNALYKLPRPCCCSWRPGIPLGSCSPEKQGQYCEHRRYTLRLRHKHFWLACSLRLKRWYVFRFQSHRVATNILRDGCNK